VDAQGQSLLHYVCEYGIKSHVQYLLQEGADNNLKDKNNVTPLDIARNRPTLNAHQEVVEKVKSIVTHKVLTVQGLGAAAVLKENKDIIKVVNEVLTLVQREFPEELTFTHHLSGSVSEDTKSGDPDEFDFICALKIKVKDKYVEVFEAKELDVKQTGTKKNFVCIECPYRCEQYKGEKRGTEYNSYTCLDYVKLCADFNKHLIAAVEQLKLKQLPNNLYIYREVRVNNFIPTLYLKWRGEELKDLTISVDIVPTLKLKQEVWTNKNYEKIKDILGVKYAGEVFAVAKASGFDDMRNHMRLTFSDIETKLI